jgi:hypothetical protein
MARPLIQTKPKQGLTYKIMAFYGKPLINDRQAVLLDPISLEADVRKALKMLNRSILVRLRAALQKTNYSAEARKKLASAVRVEIKQSSIMVNVNHPAFKPLIMGQKRQQMTWLLKARAPIPIITDHGDVIFRTATAKSMADGSWVHPGRPSTGILDKVRDEAREAIKKRISADIRRRLKEAVK